MSLLINTSFIVQSLYNQKMSKAQNNLKQVARQMMNGVVQIHVEGNLEEDIQSVMNPAIRRTGTWSGSGFFIKYKNRRKGILVFIRIKTTQIVTQFFW